MANIPDYLLKSLCRHLHQVLNNVECDPADCKTRNALRLLGKELAAIKKRQ